MATTTLHPVADGTYTEWDVAIPGGGTHYDKVDDDPHDSNETYVNSANGIGIAGNITPFLRLSSTDNFGSKQILTDDWVVYTQEVDRPGGGSWSKGDLESVEMGIRTHIGIGTDDDDSFTTDSDEVATISDEHTITKVEVQFVGKKVGTKTQTTYCTAVRLIVTHAPAVHPAPTDIEIDHQESPAINVSEAPKITAVFNGLNSTDVAADVYVQVSEDDSFSSGGIVYDSDWLALSSPGCDEGDRCEGIIYGTGDSAAAVLSSHPPDDKYYVRIKFRDESSAATESEWSDTVSGEPSEFSGINRDNALPGYAVRRKLYVNTNHSDAIPTGWDLKFSIKTGERTVAATNGCFNEAVQASGGFQIEGYGSKLFWVYLSEPDPSQSLGNYAICITESLDGGDTWETPVKIATAGTSWDTHYFPTLVIDKLGYIHVAYGAHGGSFKYTRSFYPSDISTWWAPTTITGFAGTYPVGILVPTKGGTYGRVYWFWRNSDAYKNSFIYSDNGGSTWSSVHHFIIDTNASKYRVYCYGYRYDLDAEKLHVAYTHNHSGDVEKGVWYIYCDLDETDGQSGDYGFNIWHWADGVIAGYSTGAAGSAVDYSQGRAIVFADDHLSRTFIECLELDASGDPVVFWEQKTIPKSATNETYLVCATWNGLKWVTHYISDQVNRMIRVRRSSIGCQRDKDNVIRAIMTVRAKTWWHFNPTADLDSIDITRKSEASNYLEVDEGPTDCDKDGSYFDVGTSGGEASFSSSIDMIDGTREIFTLEIRAIVRHLGTSSSCYLYVEDDSVEDDSGSISVDSATYEEISATWDTNPFTSVAWTESDLDSLQFGIKQAGSNTFRVTRVFARAQYTLQSDAEWGASEIFELTSSDNGATWQMSRELSRNSGIGTPIMNNAHHLHNNRMHVIWTSGFDLFYLTDKRFGLVQFTGDDLRVYHAGVEIDRVLDYANKDETTIYIKCQEEIPANRRAGPDDYYVYFGNPNEAAAAKSDPHEVYHRDFQNYEQYDDNENLNGQDGWTVTVGTALAYASPPSVSNKVGAGELSAECTPSAGDFAMVKTIGSGLTNVQIDIFIWMENSGGDDRAWVELEDSGANIFGAGLDRGETRAAYKIDDSWTNSDLYANYKSLNHLRLRVTSAGCSAWWNGNVIVFEYAESTAIVSVDKLRLCCNALTFFDYSRVGYSWATSGVSDPEVIVQAEEWQGFRIDATLLGRGSDIYVIDATIWGFKMGWVTLVADAISPTVVLGSIVVAPSVVAAVTNISNPTVVLGSVTATPSAAICIASTEDCTVVLGSTTATASVTIVVATINPTVVLGSTIVTPVACSIVTNVENPAVVLGSVTAAPDSVAIVATAIDPTVTLGSQQITPGTVSVIVSTVQPTIVLSSVTITATVSAVISSIAPTILHGSTVAIPSATSAVTSGANPTIVLGSLALTPSAVTIVTSSIQPTVQYGSTVATPSAASVVLSTEAAIVVYGSMTVAPGSTSLVIASVNPQVIYGSVVIAPDTVLLVASSVNPDLQFSSTTASPVAVSLITSSVNPNVIGGAIEVTPGAISCITTAIDPTLHFDSTTATATVSAILSSNDPSVILGSLSLTSIISVVLSTGDPGVLLGSTSISPDAVSVIISSSDPQVIHGSLTIAPDAALCILSTTNPTVLYGSTSATPAAVSVLAQTSSPVTVLGSMSVSPSETSIIVSVVSPQVLLGSIIISPQVVVAVTASAAPTVVYGSTMAAPDATTVVISVEDPTVALGSMTILPTTVNVCMSSVNPGVLIGAITVSPVAVNAIASVVSPIVILGSVTVAPATSVSVVESIDPAIHFGSTTSAPVATSVIIGVQSPTVIIGAVTVSPAAATAITTVVDPVLVFSSTTASPDAAAVVMSTVAPVIALGSITIAPAARSVLVSAADTSVVIGAVTVTPDAVTVIASVLSPAILLGSTTAIPSAVAVVASTLAPTVSYGSVAVEPTPVTAIATATEPAVVIGAVSITPAAVSACVSINGPTVILSSTTAQPNPVSTVLASENPVVIGGSITVSPTATTIVTAASDPTVILGAISIQPAAVSSRVSTTGPDVILGSVTVVTDAVSAIAISTISEVVLGSLSLTPTAVCAICSAVDPTVEMPAGISVSPEAIAIIAGAVNPSTILGSIQVSPTASIVYTSVSDPVLVLGSLSISTEAVNAITDIVNPTVVFGALVITPTSSKAVTVAVSPGVILGSTISIPNPVSAVADVLAPTVVLTGIILILPDGRTVTVASEDRSLRIAAEDRTLAVAGEDRTLTVPSDDRGVLVQSEDRISKISRSN